MRAFERRQSVSPRRHPLSRHPSYPWLIATCLVVCAWSQPAHAYLDPGTGSYLLQLALAGLLAGLFALKAFWARIKEGTGRLLRRQKSGEPLDTDEA